MRIRNSRFMPHNAAAANRIPKVPARWGFVTISVIVPPASGTLLSVTTPGSCDPRNNVRSMKIRDRHHHEHDREQTCGFHAGTIGQANRSTFNRLCQHRYCAPKGRLARGGSSSRPIPTPSEKSKRKSVRSTSIRRVQHHSAPRGH